MSFSTINKEKLTSLVIEKRRYIIKTHGILHSLRKGREILLARKKCLNHIITIIAH